MKKHQAASAEGRYISLGNHQWVFVPPVPAKPASEPEDKTDNHAQNQESDTGKKTKQT